MKRHIFLAAPCYAGMTTVGFTQSLLDISDACREADVDLTVRLTGNESLVTRARNGDVHKFLLSDCTHLLFFDADQWIAGKHIIEMLDLDLELVGAPVPMKRIDWNHVAEAAILRKPDIEAHGTTFAFNFLNDQDDMEVVNGCLEVKTVGTGCMLIRRDVIERMILAHPETMYCSDNPGDYGQPRHALFDTKIDHSNPLRPRYLSEDYLFCYRWREMGGKVWVYLPAKVTHQGTHTFKGNVSRLFDAPEAHEWDDIPSLPDDNPQKGWHLARYEWAAKQIKGMKVANAPCGTNYGSPILVTGVPDREIVGFDRSEEALRIGMEAGNGETVRCDIEAQDFAGYDTLVCLEGLEHLERPVQFLRGLSPTVKELVLSVPIIPTKHENVHHLTDWTEDGLLRVLEALGWSVVRTQKQDEFVKEAVLMVYAVRQ